jgi:hypothetical protein
MTEEDTITAMLLVTHRVIHTPVPGEGTDTRTVRPTKKNGRFCCLQSIKHARSRTGNVINVTQLLSC